MKISVVSPVYNEAGNIQTFYAGITSVLSGMGRDYEIIAVNDGSKDDSLNILKGIASSDKKLKIVNFRVNQGQTAAILAGLDSVSGDIIVTIDSDMENDPRDIPALLSALDKGNDVVSGWRKNRWAGKWLTRKFPSVCANWLISKITGLRLHDYGCTLKAYRREVIEDAKLYGEMHRFIPAYAHWRGAKVTEIPVRYETRRFGKSNYGISRIYKVLLDLLLIKFLDKYMNRPIHFFGGLGLVSFILGFLSGLSSIVLKIMKLRDFVDTPLPVFSALFIIVGVQLIAIGIIAEILMRTYYESQNKKPYLIKERINFN